MPRRTRINTNKLSQVKAGDIFNPQPRNRATKYSSDNESDMDIDENISRLLSESDTSFDKSDFSNVQPPNGSFLNEGLCINSFDNYIQPRSEGIISSPSLHYNKPSKSPPLSTPSKTAFRATDFGTPLADAGSPAVIEVLDCDGFMVEHDPTITSSAGEFRRYPKQKTVHLHSPLGDDTTANTSGDSLTEDYSFDSQQLGKSFNHRSLDTDSSHTNKLSGEKFVNHSATMHLPLPDFAAFEGHSFSADVSSSDITATNFSSFQCPPTPQRTPLWHVRSPTPNHILKASQSESVRRSNTLSTSSEDMLFDEKANASLSPTWPILRQSSLGETKMLLKNDDEEALHAINQIAHNENGSSTSQCVSFYQDFTVLSKLGDGNFAEVFKVHKKHTNSGQLEYFAIKRIKQQFRSRKFRDYLLNEVRVLNDLGHAHCRYIVPFFQAWQEEGHFYVQLGLAKGGSLKDFACKMIGQVGIIPDQTILHIIHDVASGLHHMHSSNLVHLDIKPANLLIDDGYIVIGDFGLASPVGSTEDGMEGDTKYLAPELLGFKAPHLPSADIFSLGLTIYELCYDQSSLSRGYISLPVEGDDWRAFREERYPPLKERPLYLCDILNRMLKALPNDRPSAEILLALQEVLDHSAPDLLLLNIQAEQFSYGSSNFSEARGAKSALSIECLPLGVESGVFSMLTPR